MGLDDMQRRQHQTFSDIRQTDDSGAEFWYARDLQQVLEYGSWDKFKRVIAKATVACKQSGHTIDDHFSQVGKMVTLGSGAVREIEDMGAS